MRKNILNKPVKTNTVVSSSSDTPSSPTNVIEDDSSHLNSAVIKTKSGSATIRECTSIIDNELWKNRLSESSGIDDNYIIFDNEELKINFSNYKRVFLLHKHISLYKKNAFRQAKRVSI